MEYNYRHMFLRDYSYISDVDVYSFVDKFGPKSKLLFNRASLRYSLKPFQGLDKRIGLAPKYLSTENVNQSLLVGVALAGIEQVNAIKHYYPNSKIFVLDLCLDKIVEFTKKCSSGIRILADVSSKIFKDNIFDYITLSFVLHEVYSYSSTPFKAVKDTLQNLANSLTANGIIQINEFYLPPHQEDIIIIYPKTVDANNFIFKWSSDFPDEITRDCQNSSYIAANLQNAYELIAHFRIAKVYFTTFEEFYQSKEYHERYLPCSGRKNLESYLPSNIIIKELKLTKNSNYSNLVNAHFILNNGNGKKINYIGGIEETIIKK